MSLGMKVIWALVAALCAVAFGFVTGVFNRVISSVIPVSDQSRYGSIIK